MPRLIVVAGVNGSGKSTLTQHKRFNNVRVVDPDEIAKELTARSDASAKVEGGREAIRRRLAYLAAGDTFVLESTLAGNSTYRLMLSARDKGYKIELHYVYLIDAAQSADRVKTRVSKGGHHIPLGDIKRRFPRSRHKFEDAALISDLTVVYDNAGIDDFFYPVLVAQKRSFEIDALAPQWLQDSVDRIRARAAIEDNAAIDVWSASHKTN